jgi:hypothetical protein
MLKHKFTSQPLLQMPDTTKQFVIESDASLYATAAVICQQGINGDWLPIVYLSQTLNPAKRNYKIYNRELLAIIRAFKTWKHYIEGSPHSVRIWTDYKNLTYFQSLQDLNARQAYWQSFPSQFKHILEHQPRSQLIQANAMSRIYSLKDIDDNSE